MYCSLDHFIDEALGSGHIPGPKRFQVELFVIWLSHSGGCTVKSPVIILGCDLWNPTQTYLSILYYCQTRRSIATTDVDTVSPSLTKTGFAPIIYGQIASLPTYLKCAISIQFTKRQISALEWCARAVPKLLLHFSPGV